MVQLDQYLTTLTRQNYIDREQVGDGKKGKGSKRGRLATQVTQEEDDAVAYQWRWGPRAYCEVGEKAIARFVAEVMVGDRIEADVDEEEEGRAGSSRRARGRAQDETEARVEKMLQGIEKAAGGSLADLR